MEKSKRNKITKTASPASSGGSSISIYLTNEALEKLDFLANRERRSRSDMANLLILDYDVPLRA